MAAATGETESLVSLPSHPVGYIAVIAAVLTAMIHLMLGPGFLQFN